MIETPYTVVGMSCEHCERAVRTEVTSLPGVEAVDVSAATGTLRIRSTAPLDVAAVAAAVEEAGYTLVVPA